jgi:hypothetical protein
VPERLDRVQIATTRVPGAPVEISWDDREMLIERLNRIDGGDLIVRKLLAVGATRPASLTLDDEAILAQVLADWKRDAARLPSAVQELRDAVAADLRDAGALGY